MGGGVSASCLTVGASMRLTGGRSPEGATKGVGMGGRPCVASSAPAASAQGTPRACSWITLFGSWGETITCESGEARTVANAAAPSAKEIPVFCRTWARWACIRGTVAVNAACRSSHCHGPQLIEIATISRRLPKSRAKRSRKQLAAQESTCPSPPTSAVVDENRTRKSSAVSLNTSCSERAPPTLGSRTRRASATLGSETLSIVTEPLSGLSSPMIILIVVVLPAPVGPSRPNISCL